MHISTDERQLFRLAVILVPSSLLSYIWLKFINIVLCPIFDS